MPRTVDELVKAAARANQEGRFGEAESLCHEALSRDPVHYTSLVLLAAVLRSKGQLDESASWAERAVGLDPERADGYNQLGLSLLGLARTEEAVEALQRAVSRSPGKAPLHYNLGLALDTLGNREQAKRAFLEAALLAPNDLRPRLSLGLALLVEEDLKGARLQAEKALELNPRSVEAHLLMAKIRFGEGEGRKAEICIAQALTIDARSSSALTMLGFRQLQLGEFEEAEASFRRSADIEPIQGKAYFGITKARTVKESDRPLVDQMRAILKERSLNLDEVYHLHFGLAKALDNLGEFEAAMTHFDEAHRKLQLLRYGPKELDQGSYRAGIDALIQMYPNRIFEEPGASFDSDLPIFIVGMMRSGTTLTEQILSSHPQVGAAGESLFWATRSHLAEDFRALKVNRSQAAALAREYCRELRQISPGTSRVTDKLPDNYLRLGLLHLAMPNAKVIHIQRKPIDNALSIYFTANPTAPPYAHSKEATVFAYKQYLKLMEHWRQVLPKDRFHEIRYEELVSNSEEVIRGMLEFLGLPWDEACLRHDKNPREVRTPSLWQVRQPMYSSSIGRWQGYEPWLGAFRELLELEEAVGD